MAGFSLVELLVTLSIGCTLSGAILQALLSDGSITQAMTRLQRERALQQRTIALIRSDLAQSQRISPTPQTEQSACGLAGRTAVLHLHSAAGAITYSVGAAPSGIWRGRVLMRCGPAYDLEGRLSTGSTAQNRVVLDALAAQPPAWRDGPSQLGEGSQPLDLAASASLPFSACLDAAGGLVALRLVQEFEQGAGLRQLSRTAVLAVLG